MHMAMEFKATTGAVDKDLNLADFTSRGEITVMLN